MSIRSAAVAPWPCFQPLVHTGRLGAPRHSRNFCHPSPRYSTFRPVVRTSHRREQRLQSSASISLLTFFLLTTALGAYTWIQPAPSPPTPPSSPPEPSSSVSPPKMPDPKQGWPGHLTPEQEQKLKELWLALGAVTGIVKDPAPAPTTTNGTAEPDTPKKKTKRFGLFTRSSSDPPDAPSDAARTRSDSTPDTDDKHGQTKQFKQALQDLTPDELRQTIWAFTKNDSPDAMLLRFLRARKWHVHNALVMLVATAHWRARDVKMDTEIVPRGEAWFAEQARSGTGAAKKLGEDFMAQIRMGKSFLHGVDRRGRPMCFVRVRLHRGGEQSEEAVEMFTVYTIETARMLLDEEVDTAGIIFDMTDFSLANMDYTPVKFMIKVFEANYPESLGHICVHRSPWVFSSIWSIIKGWLDPVVASKVHFTRDAHELAEFVAPEHIPRELGGSEEFEYRYVEPEAGENAEMEEARKDGRLAALEKEREGIVRLFEAETVRWCRGEGGEGGEEDEVVRRRGELKDELKRNYWRMDPFVRARTLYDRMGVIKGGGEVAMYPEKKPAGGDDDGVD